MDGVIHDGLWDSFNNFHMGSAAELIARKFKVTREDQDRFSVESHQKAVEAQKEGSLQGRDRPGDDRRRRRATRSASASTSVRAPDASMETLGKLRPAFEKEGTVTAGNAPGLNDGGSAVVVMSGDAVKRTGAKPLARVNGYAAGGTAPEMVFYAPVIAVRKLAEKLGRKTDQWDSDRGERGVRGPGDRGRAGAWLGPGAAQRARRRRGARASGSERAARAS